jgi:hypothetical protein
MCVFKYHAFIFSIRPPRWRCKTLSVFVSDLEGLRHGLQRFYRSERTPGSVGDNSSVQHAGFDSCCFWSTHHCKVQYSIFIDHFAWILSRDGFNQQKSFCCQKVLLFSYFLWEYCTVRATPSFFYHFKKTSLKKTSLKSHWGTFESTFAISRLNRE